MIQIKPAIENFFRCPECNEEPLVIDVQLHSIYSLGDCECRSCGLGFLQTFPIGHCVSDFLSIRKSDGHIYSGIKEDFWLKETMRKARRDISRGGAETQRNAQISEVDSRSLSASASKRKDVVIRKIIHETRKDVVILNTLDFLYGHVLLKLYNYQHHLKRNPDLGLIVIVPRAFEWLIPAEASEAWIVDLSLGELAYEHPSLTDFISNEFKRFDRVFLSMAYSHPEFTSIDVKSMTGISPFNLDFYSVDVPTFTFVLREDRWWLKSKVSYWFYRLGRRFPAIRKALYGMVSMQQESLVRETIKRIRKGIPDAKCFITGIGKSAGFEGIATDARSLSVNEEKELEWCRMYSQSHVVIGFHGSNMLLPTAFSAGCIEILPEDRYGNMMQDISVRYSDRRQSFFYRFADQYATPSSVAQKAVAMIKDYENFYRDMCRNQYKDGERHSDNLDLTEYVISPI